MLESLLALDRLVDCMVRFGVKVGTSTHGRDFNFNFKALENIKDIPNTTGFFIYLEWTKGKTVKNQTCFLPVQTIEKAGIYRKEMEILFQNEKNEQIKKEIVKIAGINNNNQEWNLRLDKIEERTEGSEEEDPENFYVIQIPGTLQLLITDDTFTNDNIKNLDLIISRSTLNSGSSILTHVTNRVGSPDLTAKRFVCECFYEFRLRNTDNSFNFGFRRDKQEGDPRERFTFSGYQTVFIKEDEINTTKDFYNIKITNFSLRMDSIQNIEYEKFFTGILVETAIASMNDCDFFIRFKDLKNHKITPYSDIFKKTLELYFKNAYRIPTQIKLWIKKIVLNQQLSFRFLVIWKPFTAHMILIPPQSMNYLSRSQAMNNSIHCSQRTTVRSIQPVLQSTAIRRSVWTSSW